MARIFIALGSPDTKASSPVFPVYVGRDGDAMQRALAASPHEMHQIFRGPTGGIFKHNARAAINRAAIVPPAPTVPATEAVKLVAEIERLQTVAAERATALETAAARLAELESAAAATVPAEADPTKRKR